MNTTTNPKENTGDQKDTPEQNTVENPSRDKQQKSDPNITELKGFMDPDEKLEPEGTDNKTS